jgi:hypothetical protein
VIFPFRGKLAGGNSMLLIIKRGEKGRFSSVLSEKTDKKGLWFIFFRDGSKWFFFRKTAKSERKRGLGTSSDLSGSSKWI